MRACGQTGIVCFFAPKRRVCTAFGQIILEVFDISKQAHQINEEIRDKEVRLIGANGEQLGVVPLQKAFDAADQANLDLVKIAPKAVPPVCRVMDYGKFRFEQAKKEKEARRNQRVVEIKEIRLSLNIDTHDIEFKAKSARKFLTDGNKLKVSLRFRGRAIAHSQLGEEQLMRFAEGLSDIASIEKPPKLEGRSMMMFLAPKAQKPEPKKAKSDSKPKAQPEDATPETVEAVEEEIIKEEGKDNAED